jgi:hypothetical protein
MKGIAILDKNEARLAFGFKAVTVPQTAYFVIDPQMGAAIALKLRNKLD